MLNNKEKQSRNASHKNINHQKVDSFNDILRGELSAAEAYEQLLEKITDHPEKIRLQEFLDSHKNNIAHWNLKVQSEAGRPDISSGSWGYFVKAFVGTAKIFGNNSALAALKEGEEHGLKQYRSLLENPEIDEIDKRHIREAIIPELELHLNSIEAMKKMH